MTQYQLTLARETVQRCSPANVATDDAAAVLALPAPYHRRVRTTYGVELLDDEIRRRERIIRTFLNREAALRLVGALLIEQDEGWLTGERSSDLTASWQWRASQPRHATFVQKAPMPHPRLRCRDYQRPQFTDNFGCSVLCVSQESTDGRRPWWSGVFMLHCWARGGRHTAWLSRQSPFLPPTPASAAVWKQAQ